MANKIESLIPDEMRGVQKVAGYRGKGKSYYVATVEDPELTAYYDFEKKGEGIDFQLKFGLYVPVTERASGGGLGIYDEFMKQIDAMPKDKYTHVVIDNTAPLETAMRAEAARNAAIYAKQFGMDAGNIVQNKYGGQGGVVNYLVSERICNPLWSKGVKLISVTTHIKPRWAGGTQVPNSFNIKGADRWDELSILTLILIAGDFAPIPSAIVYKEQLGSIQFNRTKKKFDRMRRLPYRLPRALPEEVVNYLAHPANLDEPAEGETPKDSEMAPFKEELSKEQYALVMAELEHERNQNGINDFSYKAKSDDKSEQAVKLKAQGKSKIAIAKELGATVIQVSQWLKE